MTARKKTVKPKAKTAPSRSKKEYQRRMTAEEIDTFFARLQAENPEPKGELHFVNAYTLLVAVALSAQATDVGVNKATEPLFKKIKDPKAMVKLGEDKLREAIKTIGLYRNKAKNVILLSRKLLNDFNGEVPQTREELESLPGVGRKTANVVLNIGFGHPTIAVDTHLFRVSNRTGLAPGATPLAVETGLQKLIPEKYLLHAHHWLILHGRYICKARKPECTRCPVSDVCQFKGKSTA